VVVRSLAQAGRAALANANITQVRPAPPAAQAEASGREYNASGSASRGEGAERHSGPLQASTGGGAHACSPLRMQSA
jgi:hypothetical protein